MKTQLTKGNLKVLAFLKKAKKQCQVAVKFSLSPSGAKHHIDRLIKAGKAKKNKDLTIVAK